METIRNENDRTVDLMQDIDLDQIDGRLTAEHFAGSSMAAAGRSGKDDLYSVQHTAAGGGAAAGRSPKDAFTAAGGGAAAGCSVKGGLNEAVYHGIDIDIDTIGNCFDGNLADIGGHIVEGIGDAFEKVQGGFDDAHDFIDRC